MAKMPKYINVDALGIGKANPDVFVSPEYAHGWNSAVEIVLTAPAADVRPVVKAWWQPWEQDRPPLKWYSCDYCGFHALSKSNYCPNCGAKMDGDGNG